LVLVRIVDRESELPQGSQGAGVAGCH